MDERYLVELITREVLKQLQLRGVDLTPQQSSPQPLVVIDGYCKEILQLKYFLELLTVREENYRIYLGKTDLTESDFPDKLKNRLLNPETLAGEDDANCQISEADLEKIITMSSYILVPWMPMATLSKLVSLQPESSVSLLLTKGLMRNKPIWARKVFVQPMLDLYEPTKITPIVRRVQGLVSEGKLMGIEWLSDRNLETLFQQISKVENQLELSRRVKDLLTAEDVQNMREMDEISIPTGTVVTPLARDELKRYKIKLSID